MVSIEINLIKELAPLTEQGIFLLSLYSMAIISFVSAFFTDPKAWGLMGWIVIQIKDSLKNG